MLSGMDARMQKMEASQARINEDERMRGADKSGLFASIVGADFAGRLHRGALELSDLRERHGSAQARRVGGRFDDLKMGVRHPAQQRAEPLPQPPHSCHSTSRTQCLGLLQSTAAITRAHALPNT